ncbi:ABC transporter ATP-binding protein [Treponema sp. OMZ 840]
MQTAANGYFQGVLQNTPPKKTAGNPKGTGNKKNTAGSKNTDAAESKNESVYFTALDNISFCLYKGECVLIAGANGSGKSLLMSIIAGLDKPTRGSLNIRGRCGLVFQDADTQILGETPVEDIMFGLKNLKIPENEAKKRVYAALEKTGLLERSFFPARFLSGGEKRRLAVAGILAMDCPIIIFDEPFANLDYSGVVQVNKLIQMLKAEKHTVLLLTHELEKCYALADRLIVLHGGKTVFDGLPEEGLQQDLLHWNIRHPLASYTKREDLLWT